ncbi:MAG TPA: hypothetical protein VHD91_10465 [Gaiellaceae bacterium]|nr:hypothetical protein [Gaiellaceae bacterium]
MAESDIYIPPIVAALFELVEDYALKSTHLRELALETNRSFVEEHGGAAQFAAIADPVLRAVVSDEVTRSAAAMLENLVMAAFHRRRLVDLAGDGIPQPEGKDVEHVKLELAVRAAVISSVVSLWNALDCLASCATVALRVPTPIQDATFSGLERVLRDKVEKQQGAARPREAWGEFLAVVERHRAAEPRGWFEWLSGMRNAVVHRPELAPFWIERRRDPAAPTVQVVGGASVTSRFDLHLRQRPDATDMEMYVAYLRPEDVLLGEPAERTLSGMIFAVNELLEDAAALLVRWWLAAEAAPGDFRPPPRAWNLRVSAAEEFRGVAPDTTGFGDYGRIEVQDPSMLARVAVARRVREDGVED